MTEYEELVKPGEVARLFGVDPKTVSRWAKTGRLRSVRTPGGHHRFHASQIRELLADPAAEATAPSAADGEVNGD